MCGLFGWQMGGVAQSDRLVLGAMLMVMNDTRGGDGWGYATAPGQVRKGLGKMAAAVRAREIAYRPVVMGHTRWATHGAKTVENAHPFIVGPVTGAHNGCIWNTAQLDDAYHRHCRVDSLHLLKHLWMGLPLTDLDGYGAVTWWDEREPRRIHLGTFNGGELAVGKLPDGLVWSSSRTHLLQACRMAGVFPVLYRLRQGRSYIAEGGVLRRHGALPVASRWQWDAYAPCEPNPPVKERTIVKIDGLTNGDGERLPACLTLDEATGRIIMDGMELLEASEKEE